jgi:hypothetical protein
MDYDNADMPAQMESAKSLGGAMLRNPPIRKRMEMQRAELVQRIEYIDRALKLLDENPGIEAFQDVMGKLGHL